MDGRASRQTPQRLAICAILHSASTRSAAAIEAHGPSVRLEARLTPADITCMPATSHSAPQSVTKPDASVLDVGKLRTSLGDDDELIADVIALFLEDYPARLEAIGAAIDARDARSVRDAAHALKGGASNLAAPSVVKAASALEVLGGSGDFMASREGFTVLVAELEHLAAGLRRIQAQASPDTFDGAEAS